MPSNNINWKDGTWESADKSDSSADIIITADWAPIREFDPIIVSNPEAVYGNLLPELRNADLRITNLECPLADNKENIWKSGSVFKGESKHIKGLTAVPFEAVTMANNHVFDYGMDGYHETCSLLKDNNISFVGVGENRDQAAKPLILNINNLKVGIINFSEGEDLLAAGPGTGVSGWNIDSVCDSIKDIKDDLNAIIVICHGGLEYVPFPPPYVVSAFQQIADSGADLIVGHHPHVPQGVNIYNGVPLCFSQGNFVFFQYNELKYRKLGYMVKAGISENGITSLKLIPYEILSDSLALLKDEKFQSFMNTMKDVSNPLDDPKKVAETWNAFLKFYGVDGFKDEMNRIMNKCDEELPKGAAMFRNRLTTLQHSQHLTALMTRIMEGKLDDAPEWAMNITYRWFNESINETSDA